MSTITLPQTGTWTLDPAHTVIGATARHLVASKVRGHFNKFSGTFSMEPSPEESSVEVSIDASSIDTGVEDRDNHLRSADFLDVENHPSIEFRSTKVRSLGGNDYEVEGELTMRGTTKPVTLKIAFLGLVTDPWGNEKAIFSGSTKINREEWGLTWNQALETGGWLVGKTLDIELEVQAAKV